MSNIISLENFQSKTERQETAERVSRIGRESKKNGSDSEIHYELPKEEKHRIKMNLDELFKGEAKAPFKINGDFEKLIPPLLSNEFELLQESILAGGCRDPLVVWNGFLLDGHHRFSICLKHGIPFKTVAPDRDLEDDLDARIWIVRNQFGRRNLNDFVSSILALELKKMFRQKAEKTRLANLKQFNNQGPTECPLGDTRYKTDEEKNRDRVDSQIAKTAGVSRHQIQRTEKILEKGSPEDIKKLETGEKKIGEVYKEIRKQEHKETLKSHQLPEGKYRLLYVDPPWKLGSEPVASTSPEAMGYYPRMTAEEIRDIPIQDICDKNAALFLWAPPELLPEALEVMQSWGFEYRSIFTWQKSKGTPGLYNKIDQEFLLVGEKGNCQPESDEIVSSIHCIDKKGASKPDGFRKIIENLYSSTEKKVELYPRKKCEGWSQYEH